MKAYTYKEVAALLNQRGIQITAQAVGDHIKGRHKSKYAADIMAARAELIRQKAQALHLEAEVVATDAKAAAKKTLRTLK